MKSNNIVENCLEITFWLSILLSMPKPFTLSIVFSFRNESANLRELIRRCRSALSPLVSQNILSSYELVFINDASTDDSLAILKSSADEKNDIKVVTMSRAFGVSPCVMAGLEHSSGDWVVYMDADLQDPPEVIPDLIQKILEDPSLDVVHTVRTRRDGESALKLFVTKIGYMILNRFSSVSIPVEAGDFKLLSRRVVNHLVRLKENRPFTRGLVCWVGFKQTFITYQRSARFAGETHFRIFGTKVFNNFFESALISFSSAPLKLAIFFGILAILIDFVVMGHALYEKFIGHAVPGWTAMMIVMLFFSGVQLFSLGMIGLYLFGIYEQTKNRPNYIIESTYGFKSN